MQRIVVEVLMEQEEKREEDEQIEKVIKPKEEVKAARVGIILVYP